mmetsp:Transcript_13459/g.42962  ORF Transcript_13459/g.42962 Transcript_13459/m.42962 type:complete len:262 (-) Transcript_13459:266-1051(-)
MRLARWLAPPRLRVARRLVIRCGVGHAAAGMSCGAPGRPHPVLVFGVCQLVFRWALAMQVVGNAWPATPPPSSGGAELLLVGVHATCAPGEMLGTASVRGLTKGAGLCREDSGCAAFAWSPSGQVVLCSGNRLLFMKSPATTQHVVGIRPQLFQVPGYQVLTNYQAVCDVAQTLAEKRNIYDIDTAAGLCSATPTCSYFTLSTVAGLDGVPIKYANTLWLCRGAPQFVFHLGWLAGGIAVASPPREHLNRSGALNGPLGAV